MKIVFTGGGTGGHFYPIIAIAEAVQSYSDAEKIAPIQLYYFSDKEYDAKSLYEQHITFVSVPAGKLRLTFSPRTVIEIIKAGIGVCVALVKLFSVFPDVVFAKGGYASFPTLVAARILRIPVIIHESDSVAGRVTKWAGKFAYRVAVSYPEAARFFPKDKTAHTGQPIRTLITEPTTVGAYEFLGLEKDTPVLFIIGGSLGAKIINDTLLASLPLLLPEYQIVHQTGDKNFEEVRLTAETLLADNPYRYRYHPFAFLNPLAMRMGAGVASLVISRAGSTIFEIARWKKPSIIIPITHSHGDHQRTNAFQYARAGCCTVIEESNLRPTIIKQEIDRILGDSALLGEIQENTEAFSGGNAAMTIAQELVTLVLDHNRNSKN